MNPELLHALLIAGVYLSLLCGGELFYRRSTRQGKGKAVRAEAMRKLIHSSAGLMSLAFPFLLISNWTLLALISGFVILLIAGQRFNFTTAINTTKRDSIGDILFPIGVYLVFFLSFHSGSRTLLPAYISSILILSVSDSAAALIGTRWGKHRYRIGGHYKSWEGSMAFAFTAFLIVSATAAPFVGWAAALLTSLVIVMVLTLLEAISHRGTDNITVPVAAFFMVSIASGLRPFNNFSIVGLIGLVLFAIVSLIIGAKDRIVASQEQYSSEAVINS